jgi:hypothetical protein
MNPLEQLELTPLLDPTKPEHHARRAELHAQAAWLLEPVQRRKAAHVERIIRALKRMLEAANGGAGDWDTLTHGNREDKQP